MERRSVELSEFEVELAAKKLERISIFLTQEGMTYKDYKRGDRKIKIIDDVNHAIDPGRLGDYLNAHKWAVKMNNCFNIAKKAVDEGIAIGRIAALDGTSDFVDYSSHCIFYDELDDGRCAAVDLTASSNIDGGMGNFDVLAVTATDLNQLLGRVGKLFGGEWVVIQDD